jgi:hypothetical protein
VLEGEPECTEYADDTVFPDHMKMSVLWSKKASVGYPPAVTQSVGALTSP